ncbi:MAG: gliding motility-associated C-terminal domain-containing protein [Bacteroidales bacterium]|nr:gliding motility-associated C-terminal domain-containing protein [Bacteroidales bacterium]
MNLPNAYLRLFLLTAMLFFANCFSASATHNRAGEITLRQISDLTYEIKITTFTYTLSAADRRELQVQWGDNTTSLAPRDSFTILPNYYQRNVYIQRHTFPGPGTYVIVVEDPNRNLGVKNIPNSVNVIFSVKTIITVNPDLGNNSTPVLLNYPIDKAALNQVFIHNPAAFDFDGDSISYRLSICTKENGEEISDYEYPEASDTLYVDPISGDLVWDSPIDTGIYNIAMNIEEWRQGVKIGNIARDMQVEVFNTMNNPPVNDSLKNFCIIAGTTFQTLIHSSDSDGDNLTHFITGGPFAYDDNNATLEEISNVPGSLSTLFTWKTSCAQARNQPYYVIVKTEDHNSDISLVDIDNLSIKVLAPPPATPELIPSSVSTNLQWEKYGCEDISGYNIYRREGSFTYVYDSCSPGLPQYTGYQLIGSTKSYADTSFLDNNKGTGLFQGIEYCYRITAILNDGSESFPSEENCTNLVSGSPSILEVSVIDAATNGSIQIVWAKPLGLDTIPANGPYKYLIYRSNDLWGKRFVAIDSFSTSDLNDTTYLDNGLNTILYPYSYKVELYNDAPGNQFLIGKPEIASSFYPEISVSDNKLQLNIRRNVPWLNTSYTIYRYSELSGLYDSIGTTTMEFYTDSALINNREYCYYIESTGKRELNNIMYSNTNISHQNCGIPKDTVAPCPPPLEVMSNCDSLYNFLSWQYAPSRYFCSDDVVSYRIYYSNQLNIPNTVIDSIMGRENTTYYHFPGEENGLAASYYITAVDSFGNESSPSVRVIVDNCIKYAIPNVFSPNNDGFNDVLRPYEYQDVEKIDLSIFNRWGQVVFETENPEIDWNGKHQKTNELVSPGVYYYICDVYEKRISGIEVRNIVGFIHVFHEKGATNADEVIF